MATGKTARINANISEDVRGLAVQYLGPRETMRDFLEAAILGEVERRKAGLKSGTEPSTSVPFSKVALPRGRRPKLKK